MDTNEFWPALRPTELADVEYLVSKNHENESMDFSHQRDIGFGVFCKNNRWGFRDDNLRLHRHKEFDKCYKVAIYGCSFAFGANIPDTETLAGHLEKQIDDCVVYNFAEPGASNDEIVNRLYCYNEIVKPDLTVILWTQPSRILQSVVLGNDSGFVTRETTALTTMEALEICDDEELHKYNYQKNILMAKLLTNNRTVVCSSWTQHIEDLKSQNLYHFEYPTQLLDKRKENGTIKSSDKRHPDGVVNAEVVRRIIKCIK